MTSPSCNTNACSDNSIASEIDAWGHRHLQSAACPHQHLASIPAEPSIFSADRLPYNHFIHPQFAYINPSFGMPSTSTTLDVYYHNQYNTTTSSIEKARTSQAPARDSLNLSMIQLVRVNRLETSFHNIHLNQAVGLVAILAENPRVAIAESANINRSKQPNHLGIYHRRFKVC